MAIHFPQIGNQVRATVLEADECTIGIETGDEFELSTHKCGDFCGYFITTSTPGWAFCSLEAL